MLLTKTEPSLSKLIRPRGTPSDAKYSTYECGEAPVGIAWIQFNIRFYVFALIFIIFDVEIMFLLPWAVVFKSLGMFAFVEGILRVLATNAGRTMTHAQLYARVWDRPHGDAQQNLRVHVANLRRVSVDEIGPGRVGMPAKRKLRRLPRTADDFGNGKAVLGVADSWLQ